MASTAVAAAGVGAGAGSQGADSAAGTAGTAGTAGKAASATATAEAAAVAGGCDGGDSKTADGAGSSSSGSAAAAVGMRAALFKRDFKVADYDWIGFDMDHALVRYNVPAVTELIYHGFVKYVVETKGYDSSIFAAEYDSSFCSKDVLLCFETGDFLKLDEHGRVSRGTHGTKKLTAAEIDAKYGVDAWHKYELLLHSHKHESFHYFVTYFDIPIAYVIAQLVDWSDAKGTSTSYEFKDDVWSGFEAMFGLDNYTEHLGGFFPAIKQNPSKYILPRPKLRSWVDAMRKSGKRIFLATNSHIEFATLLMTTAFGADWHDCFDLVMVNCKKPLFFSTVSSFRRLDKERGIRDGDVEKVLRVKDGVLANGNHTAVELLAQLDQVHHGDSYFVRMNDDGHVVGYGCDHCGSDVAVEPGSEFDIDVCSAGVANTAAAGKPTFLYVGDHIFGDTLAASAHASWDAICVVEELEDFVVDAKHAATVHHAHSDGEESGDEEETKAATGAAATAAGDDEQVVYVASEAVAVEDGDDEDATNVDDAEDEAAVVRHTKSGRFLSKTWGGFFDGHPHYDTKSHFLRLLANHCVAAVTDAAVLTKLA